MTKDLMQREMVYQMIDGQEMRLTMGMVKKYLVQGRSEFVTEKELMYFMHECKARRMNPFLRECWLIKYSQKDNAQIVESIHHKRSRARKHKDCQGWKKGIIYQDEDGKVQESGHPFLPNKAILLGAYFEATPKGWAIPYRHEVSLAAVAKRKVDGSFTAFWTPDKQPSQLMKVAESQGLTALWGGEIGQTIIPEEVGEVEVIEEGESIGADIYDQKQKTAGEIVKPPPSVQPSKNQPEEVVDAEIQSNPTEAAENPPTAAPSTDTKEESASNWWDNEAHYKFRKQMPFYLLLLLGRGVGLTEHELPLDDGRTLKINPQYRELMARLASDNPDCITTLDDARPASKVKIVNLMCRKIGVPYDVAEIFVGGDVHGWMNSATDGQEQMDMFDGEDAAEETGEGAGTIGKEAEAPFTIPPARDDLSGQPYLVMTNLIDNYPHEVVALGFRELDMDQWPGTAQTMFLLKDVVDRKMEEVEGASQ